MASIASRAPSGAAQQYRPPQVLTDVRLLDLWELTGSSLQTARLLQLSQPTVSRRSQRLLSDLQLRHPRPRKSTQLQLGDGACLRLLRRAAKRHRLEAGVARFASDGWFGGLLEGFPQLLAVPPRFRPMAQWHQLVRSHVIDGALICGQELRLHIRDLPGPQELGTSTWEWQGCVLIPLGLVPLLEVQAARQPVRRPGTPLEHGVLMPPKPCCVALTAQLRRQQRKPLHLRSGHDAPALWAQSLGGNPVQALVTPAWQQTLAASGLSLEPVTSRQPLHAEAWLMLHRRDWQKHPELEELATALRQRVIPVRGQ